MQRLTQRLHNLPAGRVRERGFEGQMKRKHMEVLDAIHSSKEALKSPMPALSLGFLSHLLHSHLFAQPRPSSAQVGREELRR